MFFEFDKIPKKKQNAEFTTALHPDNAAFNRFKDVLPYEDNRLRLTPSRNNKYGYINASHITVSDFIQNYTTDINCMSVPLFRQPLAANRGFILQLRDQLDRHFLIFGSAFGKPRST